jgi:hypothetical protein
MCCPLSPNDPRDSPPWLPSFLLLLSLSAFHHKILWSLKEWRERRMLMIQEGGREKGEKKMNVFLGDCCVADKAANCQHMWLPFLQVKRPLLLRQSVFNSSTKLVWKCGQMEEGQSMGRNNWP